MDGSLEMLVALYGRSATESSIGCHIYPGTQFETISNLIHASRILQLKQRDGLVGIQPSLINPALYSV